MRGERDGGQGQPGEEGPRAVRGPPDVCTAPERGAEDGGPSGTPGEEERAGEGEKDPDPDGVGEGEVGDVEHGDGA